MVVVCRCHGGGASFAQDEFAHNVAWVVLTPWMLYHAYTGFFELRGSLFTDWAVVAKQDAEETSVRLFATTVHTFSFLRLYVGSEVRVPCLLLCPRMKAQPR